MSDEELIRISRSQLFDELDNARDNGDSKKESQIRDLIIRQSNLLRKLDEKSLVSLLTDINNAQDWKKFDFVNQILTEFEEKRKDAIRSLLPANPTMEEVQGELKRIKGLITELTGEEVKENATWESLFEDLSQIDSPYIESAKAAVDWWEDVLTNPDKDSFYQTGVDSTLSLPVEPNAIRSEMIPVFKTYLLARILKAMEIDQSHNCIVSNEYEPEGMLRDAAILTGLKRTDIPFKTATIINPEHVTCSRHGMEDLLYSKEESRGLSSK